MAARNNTGKKRKDEPSFGEGLKVLNAGLKAGAFTHFYLLYGDQAYLRNFYRNQIRDTLMTLRLDSVVSSGFSISRGKAADYLAADKCELNSMPCRKGDRRVQPGDCITVRGLGKIRLDEVGGTTKKGRTAVTITRFL